MSCGIVARDYQNRYICVIQRYFFGPDRFFFLLKELNIPEINHLTDAFFSNQEHNFLNPLSDEYTLYNRMSSQQKRKSGIINNRLVEKIMERIVERNLIMNFMNDFYDFKYVLGFPKGGIEPEDRNPPRHIRGRDRDPNFRCAIREWRQETEIPIEESYTRDYNHIRVGRFNYFQFRQRIDYVPLRKQTLEIVATLPLIEEDLVGLKSLSNNYTKDYIKNRRLPTTRIYLTNDKYQKINDEINNFYNDDREFRIISDEELVAQFNKDEIIDIIVEELRNIVNTMNNPGKLTKKKKSKKSKNKKVKGKKITKARKHLGKSSKKKVKKVKKVKNKF